MVMIPEVRGAGKEWSWPVFIRPSFIPVGMLCLTDVIDHEGRHIFGAAWPDITKPISTPSEISPKTILGGLGSVGMGQYKPPPRLDPIHNQMIKEAVRWTRQLLDSLNDAAIIIDENTGDKYKLNQSLWASQDGTTVLTSGRIPPGLGMPVGWVYVRKDRLEAVFKEETEAADAEVSPEILAKEAVPDTDPANRGRAFVNVAAAEAVKSGGREILLTAATPKRPSRRGPYFTSLCNLVNIPEVRSRLITMSERQRATQIREQWARRGYREKLPTSETRLREAIKAAFQGGADS